MKYCSDCGLLYRQKKKKPCRVCGGKLEQVRALIMDPLWYHSEGET